jgi:hypothetical protein
LRACALLKAVKMARVSRRKTVSEPAIELARVIGPGFGRDPGRRAA